MTRAPSALANWSAKSETPPVPWIEHGVACLDFAGIDERVRRCHGGTRQRRCLFVGEMFRDGYDALRVEHDVLRRQPRAAPPSADLAFASVNWPSSHFCMKMPATRSPVLTRDTPSPTATTSPTPSESGVTRQPQVGMIGPLHDQQVAVVERPRPHLQQHLSRARAAARAAR